MHLGKDHLSVCPCIICLPLLSKLASIEPQQALLNDEPLWGHWCSIRTCTPWRCTDKNTSSCGRLADQLIALTKNLARKAREALQKVAMCGAEVRPLRVPRQLACRLQEQPQLLHSTARHRTDVNRQMSERR